MGFEADRLEDECWKWSICEQLHYAIVEKDWEFVKSTICNLELMLDYIENEDSNEEEDEISDDIDDEDSESNNDQENESEDENRFEDEEDRNGDSGENSEDDLHGRG